MQAVTPDSLWLRCLTRAAAVWFVVGATFLVAGSPSASAAMGAVAWGENGYGELGDCVPGHRDIPVAVCNLAQPAALSAGGYHSLALLAGGTVAAWGSNGHNQLGVGFVPEAPGFGPATSPAPLSVGGLNEVVSVSAGETSSLALLSNHTVMGWGEVGVFEGTPGSEFPHSVPGLQNVVAISAGQQHSMALLSNGTVEAWGANQFGQLGDGENKGPELCGSVNPMPCSRVPVPVQGLSEVVAISAGFEYSLALLKNGTVMAWGYNAYGQLGTGTSEPQLFFPQQVLGLTGIKAIATGWKHSVALLGDGTVMAWGINGEGQLGDGSTTNEQTATPPTPVSGLTDAMAIGAGRFFSLALRQNGTVMAWGENSFGQLGDGATGEGTDAKDSDVPVPVKALRNVTAISAGGDHGLAIGEVIPPIQNANYANWVFAGSLTPKKLAQPITLPEGSTFNGSGELNTETGSGSVSGNLSVPPFNTTFTLFHALPINLGTTVSPLGPIEGTIARSETTPGDETLTIPTKLSIGITSINVLGLALPVSCATAEPLSFGLVATLTAEELLSKGWQFTGTASLPKFKCEGPFGPVAGFILSAVLSGPENPFAISVTAPGT